MTSLNFQAKKWQTPIVKRCMMQGYTHKHVTCVYIYIYEFFLQLNVLFHILLFEKWQMDVCLQWKWGINKSQWQMSLRLLRFEFTAELLWELSTWSHYNLCNRRNIKLLWRSDWFVKDQCVSADGVWQLLCSGETRRAEQGERRGSAGKAKERQQEQMTYYVRWWRKPPSALWGPRKRERQK